MIEILIPVALLIVMLILFIAPLRAGHQVASILLVLTLFVGSVLFPWAARDGQAEYMGAVATVEQVVHALHLPKRIEPDLSADERASQAGLFIFKAIRDYVPVAMREDIDRDGMVLNRELAQALTAASSWEADYLEEQSRELECANDGAVDESMCRYINGGEPAFSKAADVFRARIQEQEALAMDLIEKQVAGNYGAESKGRSITVKLDGEGNRIGDPSPGCMHEGRLYSPGDVVATSSGNQKCVRRVSYGWE